jgi:hypothetical protein
LKKIDDDMAVIAELTRWYPACCGGHYR